MMAHTQSLFSNDPYFCKFTAEGTLGHCSESSVIDLTDPATLDKLKQYQKSALVAAMEVASLDDNGKHTGKTIQNTALLTAIPRLIQAHRGFTNPPMQVR
jgi:hypothetical protein